MFMNKDYYLPGPRVVKELTPQQKAAKSYLEARNKEAARDHLMQIQSRIARMFPLK